MKIVHILKGKANPNTLNGVNKVVHHLATQQQQLGHDVEVWGITETPNKVNHAHDYPLRLFKANRNRFGLDANLIQAIQQLSSSTVVHLHSVFLPELHTAARLLKRHSIRYTLSPHSGYNSQSLKKNKLAKKLYLALFEKFVINNAAKIHAIGKSEIADILALAPQQQVILVPNGQAMSDVVFEPTPIAEPLERPVFGYCGRLAKIHKGLDLLIQGFSEYKKTGGKGELWLIGDGTDKADLQSLAKENNLTESVKFLGTLFGDEKLTHIAAMDVFVHTSRWEGMPMAALEAAALHKPLLISEETNLGDYVRKYRNGIVLTDNVTTAIASVLQEFETLYEKKAAFSDMEKQSIKMINEDLNWTSIANSVINTLYGDM